MARFKIFKHLALNEKAIKRIIQVPKTLLYSCIDGFSLKTVDAREEEKIEAIAQKLIRMTTLLDQHKFISYGPAYSKYPDYFKS